MAKKKNENPHTSPNRYTLRSVTIFDHAENKEIVIDTPYFEIQEAEVGYCGYMEPAKAFLHYNGCAIKLD